MTLIELCARILYGRLRRWLTVNRVYALMALVFLFQAIDWDLLRAALQDLSPWRMAQTAAVCLGGLALLSGTLLRAILYGPHMGWLWRQPISRLKWSLAILPWVVIAGGPLVILPVLAGATHPLILAGMWLLVWAPVAVSVAGRAPLVTAGVVSVSAAIMAGGPLLAPVAVAWAVGATGPLYIWLARRTPRWSLPALTLRPRGPVRAVLLRDMLCLLRTEPRTLMWGVLPIFPAAGLLASLVEKQTFDDAGLEDSAAVALAMASAGTGLAMAALSERMGAQLSPRWWPMSALSRAIALCLVAAITASPALAAVTTAAPRSAPMLCTAWLAISVGAALIAYRTRLSRPANLGNFGLWVSIATTLAMLVWPTNLLFAAAGLALLAHRIRRHTLR